MKKLFALVLALIMCASILSVTAFAAPQGLNSLAIVGTGIPGIAEWDPSDPAGDMEEVSESVFVKEIECPAGTSFQFKVAGNDAWDDAFNFGSANIVFGQTAELENGGGSGDMSVSVSEACTLTITVDLYPLTEGGAATIKVDSSTGGSNAGGSSNAGGDSSGDANAADPGAQFAIPSSLAIVGTGIPGVGEWNPGDAAGDMTEVSTLVYEIDLSCPAGTNMTFKFAGNDAWDDSCNLGSGAAAIGATVDLVNGSSAGDMNLTVSEAAVLKFTVDLNPLANGTGAATLNITVTDGEVSGDDGDSDAATGDTVTVHARIPESWGTNPCFWAWKMADNTNAFTAWPGELMTQDGEWYTIEIPSWCDGVIVNDGGSTQTADLTIETGKEVWIDVFSFDNCVITYSEPGEREEPTESMPTAPSTPTAPTTDDDAAGDNAGDSSSTTQDNQSGKRTRVILIIVLVLVWIVVIALVISIFVPKKN